MTYVASPAQSWIDDYFAWLNSGQCCKYDENTLQVRNRFPATKKLPIASGRVVRKRMNRACIWQRNFVGRGGGCGFDPLKNVAAFCLLGRIQFSRIVCSYDRNFLLLLKRYLNITFDLHPAAVFHL